MSRGKFKTLKYTLDQGSKKDRKKFVVFLFPLMNFQNWFVVFYCRWFFLEPWSQTKTVPDQNRPRPKRSKKFNCPINNCHKNIIDPDHSKTVPKTDWGWPILTQKWPKFKICWLVVIWCSHLWNAYWSTTFRWRGWRWIIYGKIYGFPSWR